MVHTATDDTRIHTNLGRLMHLRSQLRSSGLRKQQTVTSLLAGAKLSIQRRRGLDFASLRHYVPGDDIRHIDWRATRRTGTAHTRTYNEERDRPVLFIVDQRVSMFFASQQIMKSVIAAELAALLAWQALDSGDQAGAIILENTDIKVARPSRLGNSTLAWLAELATTNCSLHAELPGADSSLADALEHAVRLSNHDYLVVIISDLHDWDRRCKQLAQRLLMHNALVCLHIADPLEQHLRANATWQVSDGTRHVALDQSNSALLQTYNAQYQQWHSDVKHTFKQLAIPVFAYTTSDSADRQLATQVGASTR